MFGRVWSLIVKELLAVWRDPKSRILLVVPPFLMLVLFASAATLEVKNVSIGILNRDNGLQGRNLIRLVQGSPTFTRFSFLKGVSEIKDFVNSEKVLLVLHLAPDFSKKIERHQPAEVQVVLDGRRLNSAQIVQGYLAQIIEQFNQNLSTENMTFLKSSEEVIPRHWFNPNLNYIWFTVPSLVGTLTMTVALNVTSLSVARERELGTFDQLLISPLQPIEILIGKTVPAIIVGLIEGTLMILAGIFFYKIPFTGSFILLYFSMLIFLMSITGIGLFISSLAQTQQQALLGSFMFSNPAILLSGYATPIENMPEWLQPVTLFNPLRYFMVILKGCFLKALPPNVVFDNVWPLVLIAAFTLTGAGWFFRRRLT